LTASVANSFQIQIGDELLAVFASITVKVMSNVHRAHLVDYDPLAVFGADIQLLGHIVDFTGHVFRRIVTENLGHCRVGFE
jgi:hypothetical protein